MVLSIIGVVISMTVPALWEELANKLALSRHMHRTLSLPLDFPSEAVISNVSKCASAALATP